MQSFPDDLSFLKQEKKFPMIHGKSWIAVQFQLSPVLKKPVYVIGEQQRHRSAGASVQSDQHFVIRCLGSIMSLVCLSEISS